MAGDEIQQLADNQEALEQNFEYLQKRVVKLEKQVSSMSGKSFEPEKVSLKEKIAKKLPAKDAKESSKPIENLGFKIFGAVGFLLILLGLFFLYRYAVDNEFIGVTGRIVMGVIFSLLVLVSAEVFRKREYEKFAQLLTGGGIALLYFTFYATYHFEEYREALGMNLPMNTVLLLFVMAAGVYLALRYNSMLLTGFMFALGYIAAFLSGGVHEMMITALILSTGMAIILWKKNWPMGVYPAVASYVLYTIFFFQSNVLRHYGTDVSPAVAPAFFYLICFFVLFNLLSIVLKDEVENIQNVIISVITAFATLGFGLWMVWEYWSSMRGVFVILLSVTYLLLAFIARQRELRNLFQSFFVLCITFLTISIPVQLERSWVTLAWAIEGFLLVNVGSKMKVWGLRILGYAVLIITFIRALTFDSWALDFGERSVAFAAAILALYASAYILSKAENEAGEKYVPAILGLAGTVLLTVVLAIEITDRRGAFEALSRNARQVILTIAWAVEAVLLILVGFMSRSRMFRVVGISLFVITILKILIVDLDNLEMIYRTVVTIVVGVIALAVSFIYVKNKDKIEEFLSNG